MPKTVHRTCHLCEACCGLELLVEDGKVLSVRPDADDPRSRGYACPKGIHIADVHDDPDRLRQPVRRTPGGDFEPISWEAALALASKRFRAIRRSHGADAIAIYLGNPIVHNHGATLVRAGLLEAARRPSLEPERALVREVHVAQRPHLRRELVQILQPVRHQ